jgi:prevent-host-death family protein
MKTLPAGVFKQTCLSVLDEVAESGQPVTVTKRGHPVARVVPIERAKRADWSGAMRGTGRIVGDIVAPAAELDEWDALRDT